MSKKTWGSIAGRIALAGVLVFCVSCGDKAGKGGGGAGASNGILWNSQSGTGTTAGAPAGPGVLWVDPNSGLGAPPAPPDPEDIRTYTRPDIYILGNRHPLLTSVTSQSATAIIIQEDRATVLLNTFRYNEYVRLIGLPAPANSRLTEHATLRQNARAHAKHYAVWHPTVALPLKNAEGDDLLVLDAHHVGTGRLPKCKLKADLAKQLVASGPTFRSADDVANYWIGTFPDVLRQIDWTHLGVGFWQGQGQGFYWNVIFAKNPGADVTPPTNPLPLF